MVPFVTESYSQSAPRQIPSLLFHRSSPIIAPLTRAPELVATIVSNNRTVRAGKYTRSSFLGGFDPLLIALIDLSITTNRHEPFSTRSSLQVVSVAALEFTTDPLPLSQRGTDSRSVRRSTPKFSTLRESLAKRSLSEILLAPFFRR